ncbi:hypothetical protein TELCIR_19315, partial [Teladorsagia circumcincta]
LEITDFKYLWENRNKWSELYRENLVLIHPIKIGLTVDNSEKTLSDRLDHGSESLRRPFGKGRPNDSPFNKNAGGYGAAAAMLQQMRN